VPPAWRARTHLCCVSIRLPSGDTGGTPPPPPPPHSSGEDAVLVRRDEEMRLRRGAARRGANSDDEKRRRNLASPSVSKVEEKVLVIQVKEMAAACSRSSSRSRRRPAALRPRWPLHRPRHATKAPTRDTPMGHGGWDVRRLHALARTATTWRTGAGVTQARPSSFVSLCLMVLTHCTVVD
jgi:hypothetical protein